MHRRSLLAIPAALTLAAAPLVAGQPADIRQPPGAPARATTRPENRPPMPIIDVEFAGGTVRDFVRALQKAAVESAAKTPVNVMIPAEAADIGLPAVSLKRISAETALQTLEYAFVSMGPHRVLIRNMTNEGDEGLTFAIQYQFVQQGVSMPQASPQGPIVSEAHSIRELLDVPEGLLQKDPALRMAPETVLGALKLASEMEAAESRGAPVHLMFHPDSQLLIARGTPEQQRLVLGVLRQLRETIDQRRMRHAEALMRQQQHRLTTVELEAQIREAEAQLKRARAELAPVAAEAQRMRQFFDDGKLTKTDLERAQAAADVAEADVQAAESNLMMMVRKRDILAAGGGWPGAPTGEMVLAVYDVRDLAAFKSDLNRLVRLVVGEAGSIDVRPASGDTTGSLVVRAPRDRHEILVSIFNTARRLKNNEPNLPGITLEQIIEKPRE